MFKPFSTPLTREPRFSDLMSPSKPEKVLDDDPRSLSVASLIAYEIRRQDLIYLSRLPWDFAGIAVCWLHSVRLILRSLH